MKIQHPKNWFRKSAEIESNSEIGAGSPIKRQYTDEEINVIVERFLSWELPETFCPDAGISFEPEFNHEWMAKLGKPPMKHTPYGTNLFCFNEAKEMVMYILDYQQK